MCCARCSRALASACPGGRDRRRRPPAGAGLAARCVLLDLRLPDIDGFDVMDRLLADPVTAGLPIIVCTSSVLTQQQRDRLHHARAILSKATLTREIMQRTLGDIWPAELPVEMRAIEVNVIPVARTRPLVLNVDDDAANRYVKTRSLLLGEMEVIEAETGTAALALIAERQPLLVLLDVNLPDVGGLEVCRRIKAEWPDIIVVQISATATSAAEKVIGLESGADCYLTTPVEPMELIAVTRAMLRLRHAEAQAQESGERYRMIVESAVDYAIFTCGLDGRITSWNSGAQAILGYLPEDIIGEPCARIFMADDVIADVPQAEMRAAFQGISVHAERWHRRREGSRFWSSGRMVALRDRRGEVAGFLKILYDRSAEESSARRPGGVERGA